MSDTVPGWPIAFRGSFAVAAGLVTWHRLRGPAFQRLLPDIYVQTRDEPPDLLLEAAGLPRPRVQWVVQDPVARTAVWLDLAWPEIMVGIEYDSEVHATAKARRVDTRRFTALVDKGWKIYRYTSDEVLGEPEKIITELSRACAQVR